MRIGVIMNPTSSRGKSGSRRGALTALLDQTGVEYQVYETSSPGRAIATGECLPGTGSCLAAQAIAEGANLIVAAGGDGTVGEVANGVIGSGVSFGVLPMGTGNDFARTLGIGTDFKQAVNTLIHGQPKVIDVARGPGGYFLNVAGCGFDAEVAHEVNHGFRRLRGTPAYIAAVMKTLVRMRPRPIAVTVDGQVHHEKVMLCAVANAQTYGGGMKIAPNADLCDGLLDVVLVGDVGKVEFLRAFPQVFKGTHLSHPKVTVLRGRSVKIEAEQKMPVLADGEEISTWPVQFEVQPKALHVMMSRPL